jgi:hypothetical protein
MLGLRAGARTCGFTVVVGLLLGSPAAAQTPSRDAEAKMMIDCFRAFVGTTGVDQSQWVRLFTRECLPHCWDLHDGPYHASEKVLKACDVACSPAAVKRALAVAPARRWGVLAKECGREYYGLPAGQEALLSPKWFAVHRAGVRLGKIANSPTPEVRLAHAHMAKQWRERQHQIALPLPVVVPGVYDLPVAERWKESSAPYAVVVVGERSLRLAPWPMAALLPDGGRLVTVTPEPFPGKEVAPRELPASMDALRRALIGTEKPFGPRFNTVPLVPPTAAEEAQQEKETPAWMRGVTGPKTALTATQIRLDREAPLLLASGLLPVKRLLDVVAALGDRGAFLGVQGRDMIEVERHEIALLDAARRPQGIRPVTVRMNGATWVIEGTKVTSAKQAREVFARFEPKTGKHADSMALVIAVAGGNLAQLVALLDVAPRWLGVALVAPAR